MRISVLMVAAAALACSNTDSEPSEDIPPPPPPTVICTDPTDPLELADTSNPTTVVTDCNEAALAAAIAQGGVITFNCGSDPVVIRVSSEMAIRTDVDTVIDGGGKVTLSGGGKSRILALKTGDFTKTSPTLRLQRLTLQNGHVSGAHPEGGGAAVYHYGGNVEAVQCNFLNNVAAASGPDVGGGAIYGIGRGDTKVAESTFSGNSAASGGAIGALSTGVTLLNVTLTGNKATGSNGSSGGNGGAVAMDGEFKPLVVCGSTFTNNTAGYLGSAIFRTAYHQEASTINQSLFDGNSAQRATIYLMGTSLTMTDSAVVRNTGQQGWGGLYLSGHTLEGAPVPGSADITNVTIAENSAGSSLGGALWVGDDRTTVTLTHVTIAGNSALFGTIAGRRDRVTYRDTLVADNHATAEWNQINCTNSDYGAGSGTGLMQWPEENLNGQAENPCASGVTFSDPQLLPLTDNGDYTDTMALQAGSPAIGKGIYCGGTDQRGVTRPSTGCALGAYEPNP